MQSMNICDICSMIKYLNDVLHLEKYVGVHVNNETTSLLFTFQKRREYLKN